MKDFFTRYRESRKHFVIMPAIFGAMFAFTIVSYYSGADIDFSTIQANVLEANKTEKVYGADLIVTTSEDTLTIQAGKSAQNVESIHFTLLGDPSVIKWVSGANVSITSNEPGVYLVQFPLGRSMAAGEILTMLTPTLEGSTSLALIDAYFLSEGATYSLSTRVE